MRSKYFSVALSNASHTLTFSAGNGSGRRKVSEETDALYPHHSVHSAHAPSLFNERRKGQFCVVHLLHKVNAR